MKASPSIPVSKKVLRTPPAPEKDSQTKQAFPAAPSQVSSVKRKLGGVVPRHVDPVVGSPEPPVSPLMDPKRGGVRMGDQQAGGPARSSATDGYAPRHSTPVQVGGGRPVTPPPKNSPSKPAVVLVRRPKRTERTVTVVAPPVAARPVKFSSACPFPVNVGMLSAALVHERFILVTGGCVPPDNSPLKTIGCFDTQSSSWVPSASDTVLRELPTPLYGHSSMASGNSLWLIGGLSENDCAIKSIVHLTLEIALDGALATTFRIAAAAVYPLEHPVAFASCVRLDGTLTPIAIVMCGLSSVRDNEVGAVSATGDECRRLGMTNRSFAVHFDDNTIYRVAQTGACPTPRMFSAAATLTRSTVSDASSTIVLLGGICHPDSNRSSADAVYVGTVEHNAAYQTFAIRWLSFTKPSNCPIWPERLAGFQLACCNSYFVVIGANASKLTSIDGAASDSSVASSKSATSQSSRRKPNAGPSENVPSWFALNYDATAGCNWSEVSSADCVKFTAPTEIDLSIVRQVSNLMMHTCLAIAADAPTKHDRVFVVGGVPSNGRRSADGSFIRCLPIHMVVERTLPAPSRMIEYSFNARLELPEIEPVDGIEFTLRGSDLSIDAVAAGLAHVAMNHVKDMALEIVQCNLLLYSRGVGPERIPMHRDDLLLKCVERFGLSSIPVIAVLEKQITNFTILDELGRGANGVVYQAMCNDTGRFFALKKVRCRSAAARSRLLQEIRLMRILKHKNIVNYLGIIDNQVDESAMILMEHVSVGEHSTLHDFCAAYTLSMRNIQIFTRQVLAALEYLHSYNVVHQDIKGMNVLMGTDQLKLSDFGTAVQLLSEADQGSCGLGTPVFMAPEAIEDPTKVTTASDIWSLGCLVVEMCTQQLPWAGVASSRENLFFRLAGQEIPPFPSRADFPKSGEQFLQACFQHNPAVRPTAKDLTRHPFITDLVNDRISGTPAPAATAAAHHAHSAGGSFQTDPEVIISENGGIRSLLKRSAKRT